MPPVYQIYFKSPTIFYPSRAVLGDIAGPKPDVLTKNNSCQVALAQHKQSIPSRQKSGLQRVNLQKNMQDTGNVRPDVLSY